MSLMRVSKLSGIGFFITLVLTLVLLSSGCKTGSADPGFSSAQGGGEASVPATQPGTEGALGTRASTNDSVDIIHVQDALTITLSDLPYGQPPIEERVKDDGTINLIENQTFHVTGK